MWWGMPARSDSGSLDEPTSKPVNTWTLSAETISPSSAAARRRLSAVLPTAVGPAITSTLGRGGSEAAAAARATVAHRRQPHPTLRAWRWGEAIHGRAGGGTGRAPDHDDRAEHEAARARVAAKRDAHAHAAKRVIVPDARGEQWMREGWGGGEVSWSRPGGPRLFLCRKDAFRPETVCRSPHTTPHVVAPTAEKDSMFVLFITFLRTVFNARAQ